MRKRDEQILDRATRYCDEIAYYIGDMSLSEFSEDGRTYHCVAMLALQIGELVYKLSDVTKEKYPYDWELISGLRHRLVHDYERIDYDRIYGILTEDVPELSRKVRSILEMQNPND